MISRVIALQTERNRRVSYDRTLERIRPEFGNISCLARRYPLLLSVCVYLILVDVYKRRCKRKKCYSTQIVEDKLFFLQIRIQTIFAGPSFLNIKHYFHVGSNFCTWFSIVSNSCFPLKAVVSH